jgi:hypothetical protein
MSEDRPQKKRLRNRSPGGSRQVYLEESETGKGSGACVAGKVHALRGLCRRILEQRHARHPIRRAKISGRACETLPGTPLPCDRARRKIASTEETSPEEVPAESRSVRDRDRRCSSPASPCREQAPRQAAGHLPLARHPPRGQGDPRGRLADMGYLPGRQSIGYVACSRSGRGEEVLALVLPFARRAGAAHSAD